MVGVAVPAKSDSSEVVAQLRLGALRSRSTGSTT